MKITKFLLCLLIAFVTGSACSQVSNRQYKANNTGSISNYDIKIKKFEEVRNFSYQDPDDEEMTFYFTNKLSLQFPEEIKDFDDIANLQKAVINMASGNKENTVLGLIASLDKCEQENAKTLKELPEEATPFFTNEQLTEVTFKQTFRNIVIFENLFSTYYAGAAHGMYAVHYLNYDLNADKEIKLDDILTETSFPEIRKLIRAKVLKQDETAEFRDDQTFENFIINENSISFIFNPYEVACYASGVVTAEISLRDLAPYLTAYGRKIMR